MKYTGQGRDALKSCKSVGNKQIRERDDERRGPAGSRSSATCPGSSTSSTSGISTRCARPRELCDVLVAGVVSDEVCEASRGCVRSSRWRSGSQIVDAIGIVDAMYAETTTDKLDAWREVGFHRLFKGDDWRGTPKGEAARARCARSAPRSSTSPTRCTRRARRSARSSTPRDQPRERSRSPTTASRSRAPSPSPSSSPSTAATSGRSRRSVTVAPAARRAGRLADRVALLPGGPQRGPHRRRRRGAGALRRGGRARGAGRRARSTSTTGRGRRWRSTRSATCAGPSKPRTTVRDEILRGTRRALDDLREHAASRPTSTTGRCWARSATAR